MGDNELTTCEECGNDLAAEGGVTVYYRIGLPGSFDENGMAKDHPIEELVEAARKGGEMDQVVCSNCGESLWEQ